MNTNTKNASVEAGPGAPKSNVVKEVKAVKFPKRNKAEGQPIEEIYFPGSKKATKARRHINPDGTVGGYVALTATVDKNAYVSKNACVYNHATVLGRVEGRASIAGKAFIDKDVVVSGDMHVARHTYLTGKLHIVGDCKLNLPESAGGISGEKTIWLRDEIWGIRELKQQVDVAA